MSALTAPNPDAAGEDEEPPRQRDSPQRHGEHDSNRGQGLGVGGRGERHTLGFAFGHPSRIGGGGCHFDFGAVLGLRLGVFSESSPDS